MPHGELVQIQSNLSPEYGSQLWQGQGSNILIARVPGDDPDLVNDLENIVEGAVPSEVDQAEQCLVVAGRETHAVPMDPLRVLMAARVVFDRRQCQMLRTQLPGTLAHLFYRAPDDPQRRMRLGVRIPCERVADVDDEMLEELVEVLGPKLEDGFDEVHCVYLVASVDDVRLDTGLFVQDLVARWRDEDRRRRMQEDMEARRLAEVAEREEERRELLAELAERTATDVMRAPLRHDADEPHSWEAETTGPAGSAGTRVTSRWTRAEPDLAWMHAKVDALPAPAEEEEFITETETVWVPAQEAAARRGTVVENTAAFAEEEATMEPAAMETPAAPVSALAMMAEHLEHGGYEVLRNPGVPGHRIDLAAERPIGYPQRVVAVSYPQFTLADADDLLAACKELDVDVALAVSAEIEEDAARRIVASKVKWVRPEDSDTLDL